MSGAIAAGQQAAERMMLDTLAFGHYGTGTDPESGLEIPDAFIADFSTPGKVAGPSRGGDQTVRTVTVGGTERPVIEGGIHIPASRTETVTHGQLVKVTALGPLSPAHLLNRVYRVEGESTKSYQTARRFDVVEL